MLTKNDLIAIQSIVKNQIDGSIESQVKPLLSKELKPIKSKLNRIDKTLSILVKRTDEADVKLEKRVKRLEDHVGLVQ